MWQDRKELVVVDNEAACSSPIKLAYDVTTTCMPLPHNGLIDTAYSFPVQMGFVLDPPFDELSTSLTVLSNGWIRLEL